jgi:copper homeostasis protein
MGQLEVACFNAASALRAAAAGVHRIELCSDRPSGGITPPISLLKQLRSQISNSIPINVMIRPRGGNFVYSEIELEEMFSSMKDMKPHCNGFVFGILQADRTVDVEACVKLVKLAEPLPCTFHRAFDEASAVLKNGEDVTLKALTDVIDCGFKTILTSGGPGNAIDNMDALRKLLYATGRMPSPTAPVADFRSAIRPTAAGEVVIMAGGGLRKEGIKTLQRCGIRPDGEIANEHELTMCKMQAGRPLIDVRGDHRAERSSAGFPSLTKPSIGR